MRRLSRAVGAVVSSVTVLMCLGSISAQAITAGPYYDQTAGGGIWYSVKHRTMVVSNSTLNKNLDGYTEISRSSSNLCFVSTYAALGNGINTSSAYNGYNGLYNKPSSGPTPVTTIYVGVSADDYLTGNTVFSLATDSTSTDFSLEVFSPSMTYSSPLTAYGSIEYRYPNAGMYEYVAVTNH